MELETFICEKVTAAQKPWGGFRKFEKVPNSRNAKKGDKLKVTKRICTCCCNEGDIVEVLAVSNRGDITVKCPTYGKHEHGFGYNAYLEFVEDMDDNN